MQHKEWEEFTWNEFTTEWKRADTDIMRIGLLHAGLSVVNISREQAAIQRAGNYYTDEGLQGFRFRTYLLIADTRSGYRASVCNKALQSLVSHHKKKNSLLPKEEGSHLKNRSVKSLLRFLRPAKNKSLGPSLDIMNADTVFRLPSHTREWFLQQCFNTLFKQWLDKSIKDHHQILTILQCLDRYDLTLMLRNWLFSNSHGHGVDYRAFQERLDLLDEDASDRLISAVEARHGTYERALLFGESMALFLNNLETVRVMVGKEVDRQRLIAERDRINQQLIA